MEKGIPVKIVYPEEIKRIESATGCGGGIGVIGNSKTGKIVELHKIDPKTGKKTIIFRDEKEFKIFEKKLKEEKNARIREEEHQKDNKKR